MESQIEEIKKTISALKIDAEALSTLDAESQARVHLGLAFTINSLYYSLLRA